MFTMKPQYLENSVHFSKYLYELNRKITELLILVGKKKKKNMEMTCIATKSLMFNEIFVRPYNGAVAKRTDIDLNIPIKYL